MIDLWLWNIILTIVFIFQPAARRDRRENGNVGILEEIPDSPKAAREESMSSVQHQIPHRWMVCQPCPGPCRKGDQSFPEGSGQRTEICDITNSRRGEKVRRVIQDGF